MAPIDVGPGNHTAGGGNGTAAALLAACPASEAEIPGCGGLRGPGRNPWTFPVAVYFCLTTVATIGFGDIVPHTDGGKAFVCVYAFFGVPVMILAVTELSTAVLAFALRSQLFLPTHSGASLAATSASHAALGGG